MWNCGAVRHAQVNVRGIAVRGIDVELRRVGVGIAVKVAVRAHEELLTERITVSVAGSLCTSLVR